MNCDQVFQHLTSIHPESANGKIGRHLAECPSCRQLADLFRPAVHLLVADPSGDDRAEAPESWHKVWDAVAVAEQAAAQLQDVRGATTARGRSWSVARGAVLLAVGILIGALVNWGGVFGSMASSRSDSPAPTIADRADRSAEIRCASFVSFAKHAAEAGMCPLCREKAAKINVATVCMACHENAGAVPTEKSPLQKLQSSWQQLPAGIECQSREFSIDLLENCFESFLRDSLLNGLPRPPADRTTMNSAAAGTAMGTHGANRIAVHT